MNRDRRLRAVDRDRLQARIARSASSDGQGSLSICFRLESHGDDRALPGNSSRAGRPRGCDLRLSDGFIFAMSQGDDLAVLREEAAVRDVHQLQHFRIVVQLHRHGMHVLRAGNQQIHHKCVALRRLNGWRIEEEAGSCARSIGSGRLSGRGLIGLRLDRRIGGLRRRLSAERPAACVTQLDRGRGADIDGALVDLAHFRAANDVGNDGKNDFVFRVILRRLAEEVPEDRNLRQSRDSAQRFGLLVFHDSAQQVGLAIFAGESHARSCAGR